MADRTGDAGDNTLEGTENNDTLSGLEGNDELFGFAGDDELDGGAGQDRVEGGPGSDRYLHQAGEDGDDTVIQTTDDSGSTDTAFVGDGLYDLNWTRDGDDLVIAGAVNANYDFNESGSLTIQDHYAGADPLSYFEGETNFDDFYTDYSQHDGDPARVYTPAGLEGNDQGGYTELVQGTDSGETLRGNGGFRDYLYGRGGNDTLIGSDNTFDELRAGSGDDTLEAMGGDDRGLRGGPGNDTIDGGDGSDRVRYDTSPQGVQVNLSDSAFEGTASQTAADGFGTVDDLVSIERVRGSDFNDVLVGSDQANQFQGRNGFDRIIGLDGEDTIAGEGGFDVVSYYHDASYGGTSGVDVNLGQGRAFDGFGAQDSLSGIEAVRGTESSDSLRGGADDYFERYVGFGGGDIIDGQGGDAGGDQVSYIEERTIGEGTQGVTVDLGDGTATDSYGDTDSLTGINDVRGTDLDDELTGGADDEFEQFRGLEGDDVIDGGSGYDRVDYSNEPGFGGTQGVTVNLGDGTATDSFGDSDTVMNIEEARGTSFQDTLRGGGNAEFESFRGLAGNDTIDGSGGYDRVYYAQDAQFGGSAGVEVDLSSGTATDGFGDSDTLTDIEEVTGTQSDDRITGNNSNGVFFDVLNGLAGDDELDGGDGFDVAAYDESRFFDGAGGVAVDLSAGTATDAFGDTDTLTSIEGARGTNQADSLTGGSNDEFEVFYGLGGDDTIDGGSGYDRVDYNFDSNLGGTDGVTVDLSEGTATDAFGANDTLSNIEGVRGTNEADDITGGNADFERFSGLGGNDTIEGGAGFDVADYRFDALNGGNSGVSVSLNSGTATDGFGDTDSLNGIEGVRGTASADSLAGSTGDNQFRGMAGDDMIFGGAGTDTVSYRNDAFYGADSGARVNLTNGSATDGFGDTDTLFGIENADGSELSDLVIGDGNANVLSGLAGNDRLNGQDGPDRLSGGDGNDILRGGNGANSLNGDAGADSLFGGDGRDTLNGGDGDDTIRGGPTEDDVRDQIFAGAGDDRAFAGHGNDSVNGGDGNDRLAGGFGADSVIGNDGDDVMTGSAFSDLLFGGPGFDFVNGGFGFDRVNGGADGDRFFHTGDAGHASDWIQDYDAAEGDLLQYGGQATADDFRVIETETQGAGQESVDEAFVVYQPSGQILWALVDGAGQDSINLRLGDGQEVDLFAGA